MQTQLSKFSFRMAAGARRHRLALAVTVIVVLLYAAAGFLLVPRIARSQVQAYVTQTLHRQVSLGALTFNPFTFEARVENFKLQEADGSPLIAFKLLLINAELASLWQRAINLKELRLDAPDVRLIVDREGEVNLARLAPPPAPQSESAGDSAPPRVRIGTLTVSDGRLGIEDRTLAKPFTTALTPIRFTLAEFKTDLNYANAYRFSAVTLSGERLDWSGEFTVQPLGSSGRFDLQALKASTLGSYLEESVPFALTSGEIAVSGRYRVALNPTLALDLDLPAIAIRDLAVAERKNLAQSLVTLPTVDIAETTVSYAQRSVAIKSIILGGTQVDLQRESDGIFNLARLLPQTRQVAAVPESAASKSWRARVESLKVAEADIVFVDRTTMPEARVELAPVAFSIEGWSTEPDATLRLAAELGIDKQSKLTASGSLRLSPLNTHIAFKLDRFALASLQPYLNASTELVLHTGFLQAQGDIALATEPQAAPSLKFTGDVSVDGLRTTDKLVDDDFIKWQRLTVGGIGFSSNPDRLSIERIVVRQPYARVVIAADQTTNVSHVLKASAAAAESQRKEPSQPLSNATAKPMPTRIKTVQVVDGSANFADYSIQPNFAAAILDLNGTVTGLSSDPTSRAQVKLEGKVDRYAPVDIDGEVNLLSAAKYSNVSLNFANMELTTFNPYSGKFAGYNITRGKLSTRLRYAVEDRRLDAQHHIVIDNLEFGAKTDSKDAAPIPLKLAVALLKDRNGVIELDLPVAGTLDDPEFRLAPVIWKAFVGLLKKIATAPFAAIGALFGGGDELAYVEFNPGSGVLSDVEAEKLGKLAQGLVERPQLRLNVPLRTVNESDGDALAEQAFAALAPPPPDDTIENAAAKTKRISVLESSWKKMTGAAIVYPPSSQSTTTAEVNDTLDAKLDFLKKELLRMLRPDANALDALARQRASAVQAALLANTAVDAQRVFLIGGAESKKVENGRVVRMELELE